MLLYQTTDSEGRLYQVRRAGASLRLYTDGVFHTQYHPTRQEDASLWDLLWLPVQAAILPALPRILVLGVGGGAVMGKLRRCYPDALLVGVDLNPVHLAIARRFFGVNHRHDVLLEADARAFMHAYKGPRFHAIIDDIFTEQAGEPVRAIAFDHNWCRTLSELLAPDGVLVSNFAGRAEFQKAMSVSASAGFSERCALSLTGYENTVGVFFNGRYESHTLASITEGAAGKKRQLRRCVGGQKL